MRSLGQGEEERRVTSAGGRSVLPPTEKRKKSSKKKKGRQYSQMQSTRSRRPAVRCFPIGKKRTITSADGGERMKRKRKKIRHATVRVEARKLGEILKQKRAYRPWGRDEVAGKKEPRPAAS